MAHMYYVYFVLFMGFQTWVGLIILDMFDFDIILNMTWLSQYYVVLNFNANILTLEVPIMDNLD